ncbi:hypothetical protein ANCDUO_10077 [Ancylostoma duodenale]|uniref:Uncharacterized protein n=1 Tax=Ancylostoma duodenale TaxID=51022 RepID=A0A0C2GRT4_9BILA|nr:hypothetical protein ANCDUO_10077 [Ancylostoma duodenale]
MNYLSGFVTARRGGGGGGGSSSYGSGYGGGYGYGGGGGLLSILGGLIGLRQPYYQPSYSSYYQPSYSSYYQPSYSSYYQQSYYQRAAYTCAGQQYMGMSGSRQYWYCVCSGVPSYQYDECRHP